jgi:hypothetical protein
VLDLEAVLAAQALCDEGAVARLRIALDAEERRRAPPDPADDRVEVDAVEDLPGVALRVGGSEDAATSFSLAGRSSSRYCSWRSSVVGASSFRWV